MKKITQVLLESTSISLIAMVLSDHAFLLRQDYTGILKDAQSQIACIGKMVDLSFLERITTSKYWIDYESLSQPS